jgi:hypothetical protein
VEPRQYNPAAFIRDTLTPLIAGRVREDCIPILGIDEGLNNGKYIAPMGMRLVQRGIVSGVNPLWWQSRVTASGQRFTTAGSGAPGFGIYESSKHVRGTSWPDERVVASAVGEFTHISRVCILTANTKRDKNGLRHILETEVGPEIQKLKAIGIGLLVLAQTPKSTLKDYAEAVERRLVLGVSAGFAWEQLPD